MITDTKGAPAIGTVSVMDHRSVLIDVGNCVRTATRTGALFMPDRVHIEWRNGALVRCILTGRVLRVDGQAWLDGRRDGRTYVDTRMPPPYHLADDTPEWVRDLVRIHEPSDGD